MVQGKNKSFDETTALTAAMNVFWQKGYVAASLTDLTKSMGINKPSMYHTFGNKEALFVKSTKYYIETKMHPPRKFLFESGISLKQRLKNYMMSIIAIQCESEQVKGCFLVLCQSELVSGEIPAQAEQLLKDTDTMPKQLFTELFKSDAEAIALGLNQNAKSNALSLYTLLKGAASMARSGISKSQLEYAVDRILIGIGV